MSYSAQQYDSAAKEFLLKNTALFTKYNHPNLILWISDEMQKSSFPTLTAARIAFNRLVKSGAITRSDGKTEYDDNVAARNAAQASLDQVLSEVDAAPLTPSELEYFGSLSQKELSRLYWGEDNDGVTSFAVRYRKACVTFGFVIPPKFEQAVADTSEFTLTAAEYNAMPASEVQRRLRQPAFKMAVYKLMQERKI